VPGVRLVRPTHVLVRRCNREWRPRPQVFRPRTHPHAGGALDRFAAWFPRCLILILGAGGGVTRRGYWTGGRGCGAAFHQGPVEHVAQEIRRLPSGYLTTTQVSRGAGKRPFGYESGVRSSNLFGRANYHLKSSTHARASAHDNYLSKLVAYMSRFCASPPRLELLSQVLRLRHRIRDCQDRYRQRPSPWSASFERRKLKREDAR
jgi:hypothetical protein